LGSLKECSCPCGRACKCPQGACKCRQGEHKCANGCQLAGEITCDGENTLCQTSNFHDRQFRQPPEPYNFFQPECGGDAISTAPKRDRYYQPKQGYLGEDVLSGYPFLHSAI